MQARLAEIAALAGVSNSTVSRALNQSDYISAATRARVLEAALTLEYVLPERLRKTRREMVGIVVPDLTDPLWSELTERLTDELETRGAMPMVLQSHGSPFIENEAVDAMRERSITAVVVAHPSSAGADPRGPVVVSTDSGEPSQADVIDEAAAVALAVRHVREFDHSAIGLIAADGLGGRRESFITAFLEATVQLDVIGAGRVQRTATTVADGELAAGRLLRAGVSALVCSSGLTARGALRAIERYGLSTPRDVSVIVIGDSELSRDMDPPFTVVTLPVAAIAFRAARHVYRRHERLAADSIDLPQLQPDLVSRGSTGPSPAAHRRRA